MCHDGHEMVDNLAWKNLTLLGPRPVNSIVDGEM
jgi:hypothetical protein